MTQHMDNPAAVRKRDSMRGTLLFVLGVVAGTSSLLLPNPLWLLLIAVVLLVPGIVLLYRVGRSL